MTDDLQLSKNLLKSDARDFKNAHPAVKKFVKMRSVDPAGGEPTHGPYKRGLIRSLHVGSARAVTTWDDQEDVCWLLAFNDYHRNGEPDDAYNLFNGLYSDDKLLPTEDDYDAFFEDDDDDFFERFATTAAELLERARANPGKEEFETWADGGSQVLCIDILVDGDDYMEEGWVSLTLPDGEFLTDDEFYDVALRLVPEGVEPLWSQKFRGRDRRRGEVVFTWTLYKESE